MSDLLSIDVVRLNTFCNLADRKRGVKSQETLWRGGRVAEGARLESVYTLTGYRGFESLSLRSGTDNIKNEEKNHSLH